MDTEKIESLIYQLLEALGEDPNREGLQETPKARSTNDGRRYMKGFSIQMLRLLRCMARPLQ